MNFRLLLLGFALAITSYTQAQMLGVTIEVDTAFYGPNTPDPDDTFDIPGNLDGFVTYQVYANFTSSTDVLSAIYADVAALGTPAMYIDAPCGCHNPVSGSIAMDGTNPSGFWIGAFADMQYDTYWTIGMASSDAPGMIPQGVGLPAGTDICDTQVVNGSVFAPGGPINAIAGDDLRVLIAQVTTCSDFCINANFQVFIGGQQSDVQFWQMPSEVCGEDPCDIYVEQEATVSGNILPCAGGSSTVVVEFLGAGDISQGSYQLFDGDGVLVAGPQNNTSFDDLSPGTYTMLLLDEFTCRDTTTFDVIAPEPITADFNMTIDNACYGEGDATVCVDLTSITGGVGTLMISVEDPSGGDVVSINGADECWTNLVCQDGDGSFTFTVADAQGCFSDTIISVNCPLPIDATITSLDVDCQGNANASITGDATGGSGDIYLHVNGDSLLVPDSFTGLVPGTYNVQVVDAFGCSPGMETVTITEPSPINLQILSAAPISCGSDCNGAVDLVYVGGTGELTLTIEDLLSGEISNSLDSLCSSEYTASLLDENGCLTVEPFTIDAPPPLEFLISTTPAACTGMSNGSVDIFPAGGTGELTWTVTDTLGNEANLNNLGEMLYTASVVDVLGCELTDTFSIDVEIVTDMLLTTFPSPVTCWNAEDGTITVSIVGGVSPFTYLWSDPFGQTSASAVGLTEDTYSITVTDSIGCNITVSDFVDHIEGCLFIADAITPNADGYNDEWIVGGLLDFPESTVKVYNRYGQLMFSSESGDVHWDGRFNNQRLPVADYYYVILLNPSDPPITGTVSLKY